MVEQMCNFVYIASLVHCFDKATDNKSTAGTIPNSMSNSSPNSTSTHKILKTHYVVGPKLLMCLLFYGRLRWEPSSILQLGQMKPINSSSDLNPKPLTKPKSSLNLKVQIRVIQVFKSNESDHQFAFMVIFFKEKC